MRIAYINPSQIPSLTANSSQVMKVCQAMAQVKGPVCLWVPGGKKIPWLELTERYGLVTPFEVRWVPVRPAYRNYDLSWIGVNQARAWNASLIYTRSLQVATVALIRRMPVILEQHLRVTGFSAPWLFRFFLHRKGKKRLLVITQALRKILEQEYGMVLKSDEVQVAPSGIDLERYADLPDAVTARKSLGYPENPTAAYTGNFYPGRGMDLLIKLAVSSPSVNFLWIGGRSEEVTAWQTKMNQEGIKNVILTGFIGNQHLPQYQAAADVLLMPYERLITVSGGGNTGDICSPIKMFEYMACHRPIISSDLPVLKEVLTPGNAFLCPPDDLPAWRNALTALLSDPLLRRKISDQAYLDVQKYTWCNRAERALAGF